MTESERPRTTVGEVVPLALVLLGVAIGLGAVMADHWRGGCLVIGSSLTIGGLLRLLLPEDRIGLLQARSRFFDVTALWGMGIAIVILAAAVPPS